MSASLSDNVTRIVMASGAAGLGAQVAVLLVQVVVDAEMADDKLLIRIATAIAGVAAGAYAARMQTRREIALGNLEASVSPSTIAACAAGAFALGAIAGPLLGTLCARRCTFGNEILFTMFLTSALLVFATWRGLRLYPGTAVDTDEFRGSLQPEQREVVVQALADLDAIDAQLSLGEHAAATYPAITACESRFKPLLPDADARFRPPGACTPLPLVHWVPGALGHACANYRNAVMIQMMSGEDPGPDGLEYIRSAAARLGAVGDTPERIAEAAVREARRQRNLAADTAGLPRNYYGAAA